MKSERERGEEKTIKKAMTRGRRWSLGRPNLPWRLDGKPPTAMWVRTACGEAYFQRLLDDFFGDGAVLVSIFRKVAL